MRTLAIIPCRAGSKRIPGKNWQAVGDDVIKASKGQAR